MSAPLNIFRLFFGDPNDKKIKAITPLVERINALESDIKTLSDDALKAKTAEFKDRLSKGESLDDLLPEAFAVVREASVRVFGMRHFDVQLIGGIVLHQGKISEMKTGEGKTLMSTLPAYLNALSGQGVYVVTVNDYLAKRDSEWMGQLYDFLGISVGLIQHDQDPDERKIAYQADITYGTNNEFGFDYLRDNLAGDLEECCQFRRHYAIIDEVDSILIDEARTPLIISGPVQDSTAKYYTVVKAAKDLKKDTHFTVDEKHKNAVLTEEGITQLESSLGIDNIYSINNMEVAHIAVQCLKALHIFKKDVDYVVTDGNVNIVDEFTGRILEGRRYSDGLHQAIEAVENLQIKEESQTLASITFQNYFRMFPKLSGMTGTAQTEEDEFIKIYNLEVVVVPTNKPMVRNDQADVVYRSKEEKYNAIVREIKEANQHKQPVLVGTIAIETSELLSSLLKKENIPHSVLNAKYHEQEAEIVSKAGQAGMVTIATNMAGRGTDIVLGDGVKEAGGLYVLGTERHESRRIDNQLRGRSGRQGDPGRSKFFVSLEDDLMRLFGSDRISKLMDTLGVPADTPIEHPLISRSLEKAQTKVEKYHFSIRKQILQYDDVMNKQRETIYALRHDILSKQNLDEKVQDFINDFVDTKAAEFFVDGSFETDSDECTEYINALQVVFPIQNLNEVLEPKISLDDALARFKDVGLQFYKERQSQFPPEIFSEMVKYVLIRSVDLRWMDHLHNMDILREGIGLRAYGQRDPLLEYKMEAFDMFKHLLYSVAEESLEMINKADIVESEEPVPEHHTPEMIEGNSPSTQTATPPSSDEPGRNDPCPCGSGKKYKKCCMT